MCRNLKLITALFLLLTLALKSVAQLHGAGGGKVQSQEALGRSWKGPSTSVLGRLFTQKKPAVRAAEGSSRSTRTQARPSPMPAPPPRVDTASAASYTFRSAGDSGVAELLSTAFTTNETEKSTLLFLFRELKKSYESEVEKENKKNDLAAAMTFFVASNVVTYHAAPMPSDAVTEELYQRLRDAMAGSPEIARLTNTEKQQAHDWLVYMGGFVLAGYINAKNTNDRKSLGDFKLLANQSMKLVLGIEASKFAPDLKMSADNGSRKIDENRSAVGDRSNPMPGESKPASYQLSLISYHLFRKNPRLRSGFQDLDPIADLHDSAGVFGYEILPKQNLAVDVPVTRHGF